MRDTASQAPALGILSPDEVRRRVERVVQSVLHEHFAAGAMLEHDRGGIAVDDPEALHRARARGQQVGGLLEALDLLTRSRTP